MRGEAAEAVGRRWFWACAAAEAAATAAAACLSTEAAPAAPHCGSCPAGLRAGGGTWQGMVDHLDYIQVGRDILYIQSNHKKLLSTQGMGKGDQAQEQEQESRLESSRQIAVSGCSSWAGASHTDPRPLPLPRAQGLNLNAIWSSPVTAQVGMMPVQQKTGKTGGQGGGGGRRRCRNGRPPQSHQP